MCWKSLPLLFLVVVFLMINSSTVAAIAKSKTEKWQESLGKTEAPPPEETLKPMDYIYCHPWWDHDCHHKHKPITKPPTPAPQESPNHKCHHQAKLSSPSASSN